MSPQGIGPAASGPTDLQSAALGHVQNRPRGGCLPIDGYLYIAATHCDNSCAVKSKGGACKAENTRLMKS